MTSATVQVVRPDPPAALVDPLRFPEAFVSAPELDAWARAAFLHSSSPLFNEEHVHLEDAAIGWLWTNASNTRGQMRVHGTAEILNPKGGAWQRKRQEYQVAQWFGGDVDFVITIDAPTAASVDALGFCALVEHEMLHCGQLRDEYGERRFFRDGRPMFTMRPHDVEQFVAIAARYGADAAGVRELVEAANRAPLIGRSTAELFCGTCMRRVA